MDLTKIIDLFKKDFKSYEELKDLDTILLNSVESDSGIHKLTQQQRFSVIRKLTLSIFQDDELLFNKGDESDCLYIILSGTLQMFNISPNGFKILEKAISKGVVGERGILKNKPRSLSIVSIGNSYLLRLDALTFKKYLSQEFAAGNLEKRQLIDKYIPCMSQFADSQKEKIAYAIKLETFFKGKTLLCKGNYADNMMIILEGECAMVAEFGNARKNVALLEVGSIIGEDSAFFDRTSAYNVVVLTDILKVASIKVGEIRSLLPSYVINLMKDLIVQRNLTRSKLVNFSNPCLLKKDIIGLRNVGYSAMVLTPREKYTENRSGKKMLKDLSFSAILNKNMN